MPDDPQPAEDQRPPRLQLEQRELVREDGRYVLYYTFTEKREDPPCPS